MKGYYKNWYQHYLALEKQKEKEIQQGYYSNLAPKEKVVEDPVLEEKNIEKKQHSSDQPVTPFKQKKKPFKLVSLCLPLSTALGFTFLWYQMGVEPVRRFVGETLVFAGIRAEETVDVISYHTTLLDQHLAFAEEIATYISGESELGFEDLELMFNDIRDKHSHVVEISEETHAEAVRLWSFKLASTTQMMNDLLSETDLDSAHAQFVVDQREITAMIQAELLIEEER